MMTGNSEVNVFLFNSNNKNRNTECECRAKWRIWSDDIYNMMTGRECEANLYNMMTGHSEAYALANCKK